MKRFKYSEFDCKCGKCDVTGEQMNPSTLDKIDAAAVYDQEQNGYMPWVVNSGMRCFEHNASDDVQSTDTSSHCEGRGYAVDIKVRSGGQRHRVVLAMMHAGFNRIGVANGFVHGDDDPTKPPCVLWKY